MKTILNNLLQFLIIVSFFIGTFLIYIGLGGLIDHKKANIYLIIVGFLLLLPAIIIYIKIKFIHDKNQQLEEKRIKQLIKKGKKIKIDLENMPIQTNSYLKEVSVGHGRNERIEQVQVHHNTIIIEVKVNNRLLTYRTDIFKEPEILKMHFQLKKETNLYIDENNPDNYYLDLSFLD